VRELAAFASSDAGKTFARVEQHFGRDPAASIEDDVLAHNLRAAFIVTLHREETALDDDPGALARAGGEKVRKAMNG
jgi:riboflavin biosynthesis pyrimidine reductase